MSLLVLLVTLHLLPGSFDLLLADWHLPDGWQISRVGAPTQKLHLQAVWETGAEVRKAV